MRGGASLAELNTAWRELDGRFRHRARSSPRTFPQRASRSLADGDDPRPPGGPASTLPLTPLPTQPGYASTSTSAVGLLPAPVAWYDGIRGIRGAEPESGR